MVLSGLARPDSPSGYQLMHSHSILLIIFKYFHRHRLMSASKQPLGWSIYYRSFSQMQNCKAAGSHGTPSSLPLTRVLWPLQGNLGSEARASDALLVHLCGSHTPAASRHKFSTRAEHPGAGIKEEMLWLSPDLSILSAVRDKVLCPRLVPRTSQNCMER